MTRVDAKFVNGGYGIVLEGADDALKAIRNLGPDIDKAMKKRLKEVGNRIISSAKTRVPEEAPLSNWGRTPVDPAGWAATHNSTGRGLRVRPGGFPTYNAGLIRSGLKATTAKPKSAKFGAVLYLINKTPEGAILEVAGRKTSGRQGTGGPNFIKVLNDYDSASRVIWDAYDDMGRNKVQEEIIGIVQDAEAELRARFGDDGFTEVTR